MRACGISSGGMFALEAAASGVASDRVAVYDVPYDPSDDAPQRYREYADHLERLLADGQRGVAVELFMRLAGSSEEEIVGARSSPYWPGLEALAHTLAYDAACYGKSPTDRLTRITQPTLVITGGNVDFFEAAADVVAATIPNAERLRLHGQGHVPDPAVLAPALGRFFVA